MLNITKRQSDRLLASSRVFKNYENCAKETDKQSPK